MNGRASVSAACVIVLIAAVAARAELASPAVARGADDAFVVYSTADGERYRLTTRQFAIQFRRTLAETLSLPLRASPGAIELVVGGGSGRVDAVCQPLRARQGLRARVRVPDPARVDLDLLRGALAGALLHTEVSGRAPPGAHPRLPPAWLLRGLADHAQRGRRAGDFETAYARWARGRLPALAELIRFDSSSMTAYPAVAAQFVAWCEGRDGARQRWESLFDHLASGGAWDPESLARIWCDTASSADLDESWDCFLAARARRILEPGATPPGTLRRFRAQLLLYPWEYDSSMGQKWLAGLPLESLAGLRLEPWVVDAARRKARALNAQSVGRDAAFQAVAADYARAMEMLAAGEGTSRVRKVLAEAEAARLVLEARAAAGETLREVAPAAAASRRDEEN